ncbi:hypothetical protein ACQKWADRAFT_289482 [Trichoderma austrokoningii]
MAGKRLHTHSNLPVVVLVSLLALANPLDRGWSLGHKWKISPACFHFCAVLLHTVSTVYDACSSEFTIPIILVSCTEVDVSKTLVLPAR